MLLLMKSQVFWDVLGCCPMLSGKYKLTFLSSAVPSPTESSRLLESEDKGIMLPRNTDNYLPVDMA